MTRILLRLVLDHRLRLGFNGIYLLGSRFNGRVLKIWDLNHFWFLESHVNIWCDRWVRHVNLRNIYQVGDILVIVLSNRDQGLVAHTSFVTNITWNLMSSCHIFLDSVADKVVNYVT